MRMPVKFGAAFFVDASVPGIQDQPALAALPNGRFVVTWTTENGTGDHDVRAQLFNADGSKAGQDFIVNTTADEFQGASSVTALADGRFVVSWSDFSQSGGDTSDLAVRAQAFNADGSRSGTEFLINTTTAGSQLMPALTALADGRFAASWRDSSLEDDPSGMAVRVQLFNADGSHSGPELLVDTAYYNPHVVQHAITGLADGRFVVSWTGASQRGDRSGYDILAQMFNADGSKSGAEFTVNTRKGGFQGDPAIAALANGGFVVTWHDPTKTVFELAVRAQAFTADGAKAGAEFLVDTTMSSEISPVIALPDGRFLVTWTERDNYAVPDIHAQLFNADGSKSGVAFTVNTATEGWQGDPAVIVLADGRVAVTWTDYRSIVKFPADRLDGVIHGHILDPRRAAIEHHGTTGDDDYRGTRFADVLHGAAGNDRLAGAAGDDVLKGQNGRDRLFGNGGDDCLNGGGGKDLLHGGAGDDILTGGNGRDIFVFAAPHGTARVTDFNGGFDRIDLSAFGFSSADEAKSFAADVGASVVFDFGPGNVLTLDNASMAQLGAADFIL